MITLIKIILIVLILTLIRIGQRNKLIVVSANSHYIIIIFKIILILFRIGRRKTLMIVSASSYALGFLAIILANSSIFINIGRLVFAIVILN